MKLSVYRIDTGIIGKIFGIIRETELPVQNFEGTSSLKLAITDLTTFKNHYVINSQVELDRFENPLGNSWIKKNQYYIRHPKKNRERLLIEADKFHEFIYREQISEIIAFLRSNVPLKHLTISCLENSDFSGFINLPIQYLNVEGTAHVSLVNKSELVIDCPTGLKISEKRKDYVWIDDFAELNSVIDGFTDGEFRHTIEISNSFGIQAKEAKLIGVGASWLKKRKFEIKFRC